MMIGITSFKIEIDEEQGRVTVDLQFNTPREKEIVEAIFELNEALEFLKKQKLKEAMEGKGRY